MRRAATLAVAVLAVVTVATAAKADWDPNTSDPMLATNHKMHYPQMPDPNGWDVAFSSFIWDPSSGGYTRKSNFLADDWQCTASGPVTDIHFWVSVRGDDRPAEGVLFAITNMWTSVYGNIPADPDDPTSFSQPDRSRVLWLNIWTSLSDWDDVRVRWAGEGQQGWFDPRVDPSSGVDHINYYQVNSTDLGPGEPVPAFLQEEGQVYWLEIGLRAEDAAGNVVDMGWKTSDTHFMDDATWLYYELDAAGAPVNKQPQELVIDGVSRDLAFVITPEPATMALVGLGLAGLLARRRRK